MISFHIERIPIDKDIQILISLIFFFKFQAAQHSGIVTISTFKEAICLYLTCNIYHILNFEIMLYHHFYISTTYTQDATYSDRALWHLSDTQEELIIIFNSSLLH